MIYITLQTCKTKFNLYVAKKKEKKKELLMQLINLLSTSSFTLHV